MCNGQRKDLEWNSASVRIVTTRDDSSCSYICTARNSVSSGDSKPKHINIQYVPRDFKIWKSVNGDSKRDLTAVNEGDTVNISCISQKSDPAVSGYSWYSHSQNKRVDGNILLFESISKPESGDYQCEARNNIGAGNSETITIRVQYAPTSVQITHPQIVRAGDVVQLRCVSDGHPPVRFFRWQKECPSDSMSLCPGLSQCSVSAAVEDAACNYICSARNSVGVKDSDPVRLNIQYAPTSVQITHPQIVRAGDVVQLRCVSDGHPPVRFFRWQKECPSDSMSLCPGLSQCSVSAAVEDAACNYICSARNSVGVKDSDPVRLNIQYAPTSVQITHPQIVRAGDVVQLRCVSDGHPPARFFRWQKECPSDSMSLCPGLSQCSVSAAVEDAACNYICSARNSVGVKDSDPVRLNIQYAPTSVQITHPQIVRAGDVVQLRCVSDGHPPVRFFRWQKECPSNSMSLCPGLSQCSVSAAVEDAACNYICSARNSVGVKDSDPVRLNIQYGPRNVEIISVDTVTEGTEITLTCRSEAYPKVNRYSWRKMCNGKRTRLQRYSSSVQIQMTRDDASCSYICTARNSVSFGDSKPKHINIQYAPRDVTVVRFGPQRDVKDGDRVTLTCNSRSNPEAVYTWFKDNVNRAAHKGTGKVLTIRSISPTHSGDYYCKAENQFGNSTSNSFRIEVLYGPRNVEVFSVDTVTERTEITLTCRSEANPRPKSYSWIKMCNGQRTDLEWNSASVRIVTTRDDSSCSYICTARNSVSSGDSKPKHINIQYVPRDFKIWKSVNGDSKRDLTAVNEGDTVNISCISQKSDPAVSGYSWYSHSQNKRVDGNILLFESISKPESGDYQCEARNNIGAGNSETITIRVQYAPTSVQITHPQIVRAGDVVQLRCVSDGHPPVRFFRWQKECPSDSMSLCPGLSQCSVSAAVEDAACNYICSARNSVGVKDSDPVRLNIQYAPTSVQITHPQIVRAGDVVQLRCVSDGHPPVRFFRWQKECPSDSMSLCPGLSQCSVSAAVEDAACNYICSARNSVGVKDSDPVRLNIQYAPRDVTVVHTEPQREVKDGDRVSLNCNSRSNPEAVYTWFKDNVNRAAHKGTGKVLTIRSISRTDSGDYYCKAENWIGASTSNSFRIEVLYGPRNVEVFSVDTVTERTEITLTCRSEANPRPKSYCWIKMCNGQRTDLEWNTASVRIVTTRDDASCSYVCTARNSVSSGDSNPKHINIQYAPTSVQITHPQIVRAGDVVQLRCVSDGHPPVRFFRWQKECPSDSMSLCPGLSQCSVSAAVEDAACNYICSARNSVGVKDSDPVRLNIQYAPRNMKVLITPLNSTINEGDNITLSCTSDSNPPPSWYKWTRRKGEETEALESSERDLTLYRVTRKQEGVYSCQAGNTVGANRSEECRIEIRKSSFGLIIGICMAPLAFIITMVLVIVCYRRKQNTCDCSSQQRTEGTNTAHSVVMKHIQVKEKTVYENMVMTECTDSQRHSAPDGCVEYATINFASSSQMPAGQKQTGAAWGKGKKVLRTSSDNDPIVVYSLIKKASSQVNETNVYENMVMTGRTDSQAHSPPDGCVEYATINFVSSSQTPGGQKPSGSCQKEFVREKLPETADRRL
ncbi:hemicentin-1-like [Stegostoma tigrinum]|uniref:hemicentin-1-like n=1 Tax=Stegostoma tigrinum TaxID=3053191 RepID=UPI0028700774|nr:hemicentin-1-like [Stegostoma tigrinum]